MAGNVWEWTRSSLADYPSNPADPKADSVGLYDEDGRMARGGAFDSTADIACCAFRVGIVAFSRGFNLGFRVVLRSAA
jgi:formylglycine-generating enzyme required for sulfatase activity